MDAAMAPVQDEIGLLNVGLLFLLLTLLISAYWGRGVGLFAAVVANLALNFFFVEPLHELTVQSPENVVALILFLVVAIIGSSLLAAARSAAARARTREAGTQVLLRLSRSLIGQTDPDVALTSLCEEVVDAFRAPGASVLSASGGGWRVLAHAGAPDAGRPTTASERLMAQRAVETSEVARTGYTGFGATRRIRIVGEPGASRVSEMEHGVAFVPLQIGGRVFGVLRLDGPIGETAFRYEPDRLLSAFASEAALGVQRAELATAAAHTEALKQADEMKSALMTSISHDLKTPLAGIKTSVSSLLDTSVDWSEQDKRAFLETIDSQADRLNRVISDILDLNRIEAGVIAPVIAPVNVQALFDDVRERVEIVLGKRPLLIDAPGDSWVMGDASLLAQALVNLVENAVKYSTPGGAIYLRAVPAGGNIDLIVEDEGPGIAAADLPHVFERFYRAAEQSRRVKGSGLGLAIVKGFVTLCGGSVRVESSPSGTRFLVTLPASVREKVTA
jgi:two-component system sensor histidine kinase KdpD